MRTWSQTKILRNPRIEMIRVWTRRCLWESWGNGSTLILAFKLRRLSLRPRQPKSRRESRILTCRKMRKVMNNSRQASRTLICSQLRELKWNKLIIIVVIIIWLMMRLMGNQSNLDQLRNLTPQPIKLMIESLLTPQEI